MATFVTRPDGLNVVTLDDGGTVATALTPDELEAAGVMPGTPAAAQPGLYADPGFAPPPPRAGTEGTAQLLSGQPVAGPADPFGLGAGAPQQPLPAPPVQQGPPPPPVAGRAPTAAEQAAGMSFPPPAAPVVSAVPRAGQPGAGVPAGQDPRVAQAVQDVIDYERPGGGPVRTIPEHWVPTTEQRRTTGAGFDPETQGQIDKSRLDRQLAAQEVSDAQAEAADQRRVLATQEAVRVQGEHEDALVRKAEIDREFKTRMGVIDSRLNEIKRGNAMGTPRERVMASRGWFSNVLAAIGTVMAAPAMQYLGGRNLATEAVDREVEQEVERQKALYQEAEDQRSVLRDMMAQGMSPQTAEQTVRLLAREEAAARLAAWAARSESDLVRKNFDMWVAEDSLARAREYAAIQDQIAGEVVQGAKFVPERKVGGPAPPMDPLKRLQRGAQARQYADIVYGPGAAGSKEAGEAREKARAQFVQGEGYARTEEEAKKLRAAKGGKDTLIDLADQVLATRRDYADGKIDLRAANARLRSLSTQAADANRLFTGSGTLDAGYQAAWSGIFGNPALPESGSEAFGRLLKDTDEQVRTFRNQTQRNWDRNRPTNFTANPTDVGGVTPRQPASFEAR